MLILIELNKIHIHNMVNRVMMYIYSNRVTLDESIIEYANRV